MYLMLFDNGVFSFVNLQKFDRKINRENENFVERATTPVSKGGRTSLLNVQFHLT